MIALRDLSIGGVYIPAVLGVAGLSILIVLALRPLLRAYEVGSIVSLPLVETTIFMVGFVALFVLFQGS